MLIPRNVFHVADAASRDATRFQLQGVRFQREGTTGKAAATDGKVLIESTWPMPDFNDFPSIEGICAAPVDSFAGVTIPTATCTEAMKSAPRVAPHCREILKSVALDETCNGKVHLASTDLDRTNRTEGNAIEGKYPAYENAFPGKATMTVLLDPHKVIQVLKAMIAIHGIKAGNGEGSTVKMEIESPDRPVMFTRVEQDGSKTRGMVMPLVLEKK